jgi:hypothetical protein
MRISLTPLLAILSSIFRSRTLQLEDLALRHQIGVLRRSAIKRPKLTLRRPSVEGVAVRHLERLALSASHRHARNGHCLASRRLSFVLDLEDAAPAKQALAGLCERLTPGCRAAQQQACESNEL